jgi:hypothetical protein
MKGWTPFPSLSSFYIVNLVPPVTASQQGRHRPLHVTECDDQDDDQHPWHCKALSINLGIELLV